MSTPRFDLTDVEDRLDAGERVIDIAAFYGVSARTIRNRLHTAGRPTATHRRRASTEARLADPVWLHQQFITERRSPSLIAGRLNVTTHEVLDCLRLFGIERPPQHLTLTAEALSAAFAAGDSLSSIARHAGVDRHLVRRTMRAHHIVNPRVRPRRPPELDDTRWLQRRYVDEHTSVAELATELGAAAVTVTKALTRVGIARRPTSRQRVAAIEPDWLKQQYVTRRRRVADIATELGVVPTTIYNTLKRFHIDVIPRQPHPVAGIDRIWLRQQYVTRRRTIADIANELGVARSTVTRAAFRYRFTPRKPRRGEHALSDPGWLRRRHVDDRATAVDIANELGIPASFVRSALRHHHITRNRRRHASGVAHAGR
jgi:transposase-like protein